MINFVNNKRHKIVSFFIYLFFWFSISECLIGQGVTSNWQFGVNAGIRFENYIPNATNENILTIPLSCSSISSPKSDLIYYAKPDSAIGSQHVAILNSENISGTASTTQGALFVPNPIDPSVHYLFTIESSNPNKLHLHTIRRTIASPTGTMQSSEKNYLLSDSASMCIGATLHENGRDVWVILKTAESNRFLSYLITENGVDSTPMESVVDSSFSLLFMKASPNGKLIAGAQNLQNNPNSTYVFNFNNATRILSNQINIHDWFLNAAGLEFSGDNRFLYFSNQLPTKIIR